MRKKIKKIQLKKFQTFRQVDDNDSLGCDDIISSS
jgi:hypothetical protein